MVRFKEFSRNGDILEGYVTVTEQGSAVVFFARYNMKTEEMKCDRDVSGFVYNQAKKGFSRVAVNMKKKNTKYGEEFVIAWG